MDGNLYIFVTQCVVTIYEIYNNEIFIWENKQKHFTLYALQSISASQQGWRSQNEILLTKLA